MNLRKDHYRGAWRLAACRAVRPAARGVSDARSVRSLGPSRRRPRPVPWERATRPSRWRRARSPREMEARGAPGRGGAGKGGLEGGRSARRSAVPRPPPRARAGPSLRYTARRGRASKRAARSSPSRRLHPPTPPPPTPCAGPPPVRPRRRAGGTGRPLEPSPPRPAPSNAGRRCSSAWAPARARTREPAAGGGGKKKARGGGGGIPCPVVTRGLLPLGGVERGFSVAGRRPRAGGAARAAAVLSGAVPGY